MKSLGGFRLLTEPASLKRQLLGAHLLELVVFPAPHRAGLIEATCLPGGPAERTGCFRLLTEPASLKLRRLAAVGSGRGPVSGSSQSRPH